MDWKENINNIREIYPGHFQVILDFATVEFLSFALSDEYNYVWIQSHQLRNSLEWNNYNLPLFNNQDHYNILARNISFDYAMPTIEFKSVLPKIGPGITLIQVNSLPPYYLNLERIKGKKRYELLQKECDYLFEIDLPSATDYGTLVSSNRDFLQSLLDNKTIDWSNLP